MRYSAWKSDLISFYFFVSVKINFGQSLLIQKKESQRYRGDLVPSVLACFSDPDSRVRYYACESLYNIVKVLRASVLIYFNEIFDGLCKVNKLKHVLESKIVLISI